MLRTIRHPLLTAVAGRSLLVGAGLHFGAVLGAGTVTVTLPAAVLIVAVSDLAVWLDTRRRGEHLLLANFGYNPLTVHAWAATPVACAELLVMVVSAL